MATTNLFVELIVIGTGAAVWGALLLLSVFGMAIVPDAPIEVSPLFVFFLAVVYLLGIISDRVADFFFDQLFSGPLRQRYFANTREYQDSRRLVLSSSSRLADMHDYGRTRIRICRGWALNAALIAVTVPLAVQLQFASAEWAAKVSTMGAAAGLALSLGSWWSWRMLCSMEYLKIREHAEFLRDMETASVSRRAA